ncbi:uncharacterized protein BKA55DRAFT_684196 [Fusarium redolens]|uniref:Uncharacterized protein n=1 Tax=Fusarium redolens TaxID=48865 RepID=A0A9P9KR11_FUSRE|nr:uncharacterized protein BKA55DRAFT_684196 [Fusarium redolens]KAH7266925.1 hypothetical protein BKA55DRAFT_684196 [Fusarium redolens]
MKMTAAIESIMESNSVEDDELDEILVVVKGIYLEHIRDLEEAVEVGGAMPTLIEGNTGAFECILQPSSLLMHRYDGTAMRDSVYEQMILNRFDGTAQARNPREPIGNLPSASIATNTVNKTSPNTFTTACEPIDMMTRPSALPPPDQLVNQDVKKVATDVFLNAIATNSSYNMVDVIDMGVVDVGRADLTLLATVSVGTTTQLMNDTPIAEHMYEPLSISGYLATNPDSVVFLFTSATFDLTLALAIFIFILIVMA